MARFNWQGAIQALAVEVEVEQMAAQRNRRDGRPNLAAQYEKNAAHKASFAAWIARSYCRKGRSTRAAR